VETLVSSSFPSLDQAATEAIMRWHFAPALRDGQPVPDTRILPIHFSLN
jgi:TonB family protein